MLLELKMRNILYVVLVVVVILSVLLLSNVVEIMFSEVFDYNVFILGDYIGYKLDVEGNFVVGGNFMVFDFDVGF